MVEQIPKIGDDSVGAGGVVIRSEARRERLVPIERASNPPERILVNLDVGVDEHDYVSPGPPRAEVSCGRRAEALGRIDDDQLLGADAARSTAATATFNVAGLSVAGITTLSVVTC